MFGTLKEILRGVARVADGLNSINSTLRDALYFQKRISEQLEDLNGEIGEIRAIIDVTISPTLLEVKEACAATVLQTDKRARRREIPLSELPSSEWRPPDASRKS